MKYFLDNCLSPKYAAMLTAVSATDTVVMALRQEYEESTPDEEWIPKLGANGWVLISKDREQRKKPELRKALAQNRVTAFYLAKSFDHQPLMEVAWRLVKYWSKITHMGQNSRKGSQFLVDINGGVEVLPP